MSTVEYLSACLNFDNTVSDCTTTITDFDFAFLKACHLYVVKIYVLFKTQGNHNTLDLTLRYVYLQFDRVNPSICFDESNNLAALQSSQST